MHNFIGKSLLIEENGLKTLVFSDFHLGYGESLRRGGVFLPVQLIEQTLRDSEKILTQVGTVDEVVLLGDLKHAFGPILQDEWSEVDALLALLQKFCNRVILIKGNHDSVLAPFGRVGVEVHDYYIRGSYCFVHGDKDFDVLYQKEVRTWVVGHAHPALVLREGQKEEKYKCFLVGSYKKKEVIVLPSFFLGNEGSDICSEHLGLAWPLDVARCTVFVVGEGLEVLDFGSARNFF